MRTSCSQGPGRTAKGDNYHFRVTANYEAICYELTLPNDADKIEVLTAPNCPGADASERKYLGGTVVVIHALGQGQLAVPQLGERCRRRSTATRTGHPSS